MNRRGFFKLLTGGIAALKVLGLPVEPLSKSLKTYCGGELVLSPNTQLCTAAFVKRYAAIDLNGWCLKNGDPDITF